MLCIPFFNISDTYNGCFVISNDKKCRKYATFLEKPLLNKKKLLLLHRLLTRTPRSLVHGVMVVTTGFGSVSPGSIPGGPTE